MHVAYLLGFFVGTLPVGLFAAPLGVLPWQKRYVFAACLALGALAETYWAALYRHVGGEPVWGQNLLAHIAAMCFWAFLVRYLYRRWQARKNLTA